VADETVAVAPALSVEEKAQRKRDLLVEVQGLDQEDMPEIIFKETSPARRRVMIYSMRDGEPLPIPKYMLDRTLSKRLDDGTFMFTTRKEEAPEYKLGTIRCFLHPESPDRVILEEIGLSGASCPAAGLATLHAKRMHGLHRHKEEWDAYQEFLTDKKEADAIAEQRAQTAAMLALGEKAVGAPTVVESTETKFLDATDACDQCDYTGTANQLRGHKMGAHK
jgi:hypothetical protein